MACTQGPAAERRRQDRPNREHDSHSTARMPLEKSRTPTERKPRKRKWQTALRMTGSLTRREPSSRDPPAFQRCLTSSSTNNGTARSPCRRIAPSCFERRAVPRLVLTMPAPRRPPAARAFVPLEDPLRNGVRGSNGRPVPGATPRSDEPDRSRSPAGAASGPNLPRAAGIVPPGFWSPISIRDTCSKAWDQATVAR